MTISQTLLPLFEVTQYLASSIKYDPLGSLWLEWSTENTNNYYRLMVILITKACATVECVWRIDKCMPNPSSYIWITTVFSLIIKIWSIRATISRSMYRRHKQLLQTYGNTNYQWLCNCGRRLNNRWLFAEPFYLYFNLHSI